MYVCHDCEHANPVKLGKCPNCKSFGTFIKDPTKVKTKSKSVRKDMIWARLQQWDQKASVWYDLQHPEMERVLSWGIKKWGLYLLGWEPGIGKSTLMLQVLQQLTRNNSIKIAYFSWEEDSSQITDRYQRLTSGDVLSIDIYQAHHLEDIIATTESNKYDMIIIDSIQTVYTPHHESVAGSIAQIKRCSEKISERCKTNTISCFLVGHVTKGGEIAWPKYLEHIVDVVLYLEWDRYGQYRFLRTKKNRFGPSDEVGIFDMTQQGLQPVYDYAQRILQHVHSWPWSVLSYGIDNGRPVLIQIEVLLHKTWGKFPQNICQWIDTKRVQVIRAILEKHLKLRLGNYDIYLNIPGEQTFRDTGLDLAIATAIYSQLKWLDISKELIFVWELWLSGKVLKSKLHKKRVQEAQDFQIIDNTRLDHISELVKIL